MKNREVESAKQDISDALVRKFSAPKGNLERAFRKSRRKIPKSIRSDVEKVLEVEQQLANPVTRRRVNMAEVKKTKNRILRKTEKIDLEKQKIRGRYLLANELVFKLLILAGIIFLTFKYLVAT